MSLLRKAMRLIAYSIKPEHLHTLWYEDKDGNFLGEPNYDTFEDPPGSKYQVSRFPTQLTESHLELISQQDVDACPHAEEHIRKTYGWIDGVEGRECAACGGTQTKDIDQPWPDKWEGGGSREAMVGNSGWDEELVLAMVNSGDYSLSDSIIVSATCCERCWNSLRYDYGLDDSYPEGSEDWHKSGTSCQFCED